MLSFSRKVTNASFKTEFSLACKKKYKYSVILLVFRPFVRSFARYAYALHLNSYSM